MDSKKVMIVEDKALVAEDCRHCLENLNFSVTSLVASGEEAIERAEADRPDVVLMDIHLRDEMDGIEAAEQIHSRFGIPVVFLSAYSDHGLLERAKRVGSFGYLIKPFEERELLATLEMALYKAKADASVLAEARMEATATLAGGIAHDYNNLMCVVLGNAGLVQKNLDCDHPDTVKLQQIKDAARKASDLAQRLLAFARGGTYQIAKMDLNLIVSNTLQIQEQTLPYGIQIKRDLASDLWAILADRAQMEMTLTSLCTNAVEALEEGGDIRIATRNIDVDHALAEKHPELEPGRYVVLRIEDTGHGMTDEVRTKAFEPFFSTKFLGRGLGLAAVSGIARNHEGCVVLESEDGKGTTCTLYLPAVEEEEEKEQPEPQTTDVTVEETILVVDDDEMLLEMMTCMLTPLGYQVLTANGGQAAVDLSNEHEGDIHLTLLDMGMPIMNGATTLPLLKAARPEMKVLLFSGYELDAIARTLLDAGASGFLQKPVSSEELAKEIRKVLAS